MHDRQGGHNLGAHLGQQVRWSLIVTGVEKVERASAVDLLEDPTQDDVDKDDGSDTNPRHLEHGDGISLFRHSGQPGGAAFQVRRKGGKHFVLRVTSCQLLLSM